MMFVGSSLLFDLYTESNDWYLIPNQKPLRSEQSLPCCAWG
jgi:hypothetical protein